MEQEFFTNLPSEIIIEILSRLPVLTIIRCQFVCKQWLSLLETDVFLKSHHSKSVPGLIVNGEDSCIFFEFGDVLQLEHHDDRYIPVIEFNSSGTIKGSANGLLFSYLMKSPNFLLSDDLNIINPITGEYIRIRDPQRYEDGHRQHFTYGFGVGRRTGQHSVVRIFHVYTRSNDEVIGDSFPSSHCQVYTLGTRSWRSINPGPLLEYDDGLFGAFLNGSLYWLVFGSNGCPLISCFDLDDELFSTIPSLPALLAHATGLPAHKRILLQLSALEDRLCLSDNVSDDELVIWFMKDCGDKKSWSKDIVICKSQIPDFLYEGLHDVDCSAHPVKVFEDGDILMTLGGWRFFYYSTKTQTSHGIDIFERDLQFILHSPSFLSLKRFAKERVRSFGHGGISYCCK